MLWSWVACLLLFGHDYLYLLISITNVFYDDTFGILCCQRAGDNQHTEAFGRAEQAENSWVVWLRVWCEYRLTCRCYGCGLSCSCAGDGRDLQGVQHPDVWTQPACRRWEALHVSCLLWHWALGKNSQVVFSLYYSYSASQCAYYDLLQLMIL